MGPGDLIKSRAFELTRHSSLVVKAIRDQDLLEVSQETGLKPYETLKIALEEGVWPQRYLKNTECLSIQEQLKLHTSHVGVVGTGGLGGNVISCLARVGVGRLTLIDQDSFEETNLNRQAFCHNRSLGEPKALYAASAVKEINPFLRLSAYKKRFDLVCGKEVFLGVDLLIDALDNRRDRISLEGLAKELSVPLIHGAVAGLEGQVMTVFPADPGIERLYGPQENGEGPRPEEILGVLCPTPMLIGAIQAAEAVKVLLGRGRPLRNTLLYCDLESMAFSQFKLEGKEGP
jgi:molybdopterin/thiamine biosynthesis adenylyltransferase